MSGPLVSTRAAAASLGVGQTFVSALKRAMGLRRHKVDVGHLRRWLAQHPEFTVTSIYPKTPPPRSRA